MFLGVVPETTREGRITLSLSFPIEIGVAILTVGESVKASKR